MNAFPDWQHRYTARKPIAGWGVGRLIKVEAGLHYLRGNTRPYFSVTADIYKPGAQDSDAGGCMHDEILRTWPQLAPVVALHLCDDSGQPMHAEANGWYQLAGYYATTGERYHAGNSMGQHAGEYRYPTPYECLQQFAAHVRLPMADAITLAGMWSCPDDWRASRRWYGEWLATQADRFADDARAALALLDSLIAAQAANV